MYDLLHYVYYKCGECIWWININDLVLCCRFTLKLWMQRWLHSRTQSMKPTVHRCAREPLFKNNTKTNSQKNTLSLSLLHKIYQNIYLLTIYLFSWNAFLFHLLKQDTNKLKKNCGRLRTPLRSCYWGWGQIFLVSDTLFHESLIVLSPHQTRIQRSTLPLEGAGPLFQEHVPTATWAGREGPHLHRHPCCPVRSPGRRNISTYLCCWRRRASAPLMTPLIKVTDQILQLLAAWCRVTQKCVCEPWHSLCLWSVTRQQLFFQTVPWHDHHLPLLLLASVQKKKVFQFLWCFYCLDCKQFSVAFVHWNLVWIVRFFFTNLYCSLVPISFIKGVDLIGTESKALWSLCLLHLSVSVSLSSCHCTAHIL